MMRKAVICAFVLVVAAMSQASDFYIDPEGGDPANDGSAKKPWRSLQEVFDKGLVETRTWDALPYQADSKLMVKNAGAPVKANDTIWLKDGYYGDLKIDNCYNSGNITIASLRGHTPRFRKIKVRSSSHWVLKGLHVGAQFESGKRPRTLIHIADHNFRGPVSDVVVENCVITSADDTSRWSVEDWNKLACNGIALDGTRITVRRNLLKNINFGISVTASHSLIEHNTVENFSGDGLRGLGDYCVFQYNTVKNCYDVNANHDDGFQSWSRGPKGKSGQGKVTGVVLRGNTIINYEDPNQPHRGTLQGIGCFDGMFVDWIIENNVVIVDHYHGITFLGARNCRIVNNTVIDLNNKKPGPAWICIDKHKNGTPVADCLIRNNLTPSIKAGKNQEIKVDHNIIIDDLTKTFSDFSKNDLRLKKGSSAIDAGSKEQAPSIDIIGTRRPQGKAIDVGAFEWLAN